MSDEHPEIPLAFHIDFEDFIDFPVGPVQVVHLSLQSVAFDNVPTCSMSGIVKSHLSPTDGEFLLSKLVELEKMFSQMSYGSPQERRAMAVGIENLRLCSYPMLMPLSVVINNYS